MMIALLLVAQAQLFSDANAAYLSGDIPRATAAYEALVAEGVASPALETNLGTAYLRQGKRGLAALHFERALFLDPADDDARADLVELRRGNVDKLEGESDEGGSETISRVLAPLPGSAAAVGFLVLWIAGWSLFGVRFLRPERGGVVGWAVVSFALSGVCALVTFGAAQGRKLALERAVVVAQSAPAREGPREQAVSHFEVHEGTTVRVEDEEGSFRRVKLANGLTGWVPSGAVEMVVPKSWSGGTSTPPASRAAAE